MNNMPSLVRTRCLHTCVAALTASVLMAGHPVFAQSQPSAAQAAAPAVAPADDTDEAQATPEPRVAKGDATRSWLGAQASRKQASSTRQTLSGPVMSTIHGRYVRSFGLDIERTPIRADMPNTNR
jgi:hypothetical protein